MPDVARQLRPRVHGWHHVHGVLRRSLGPRREAPPARVGRRAEQVPEVRPFRPGGVGVFVVGGISPRAPLRRSIAWGSAWTAATRASRTATQPPPRRHSRRNAATTTTSGPATPSTTRSTPYRRRVARGTASCTTSRSRTCEGPTRGLESVSTEATGRQARDRLGKRFGARGNPPKLFSRPAVRTAAVENPLTSSPTQRVPFVRTIRTNGPRRCFCAEPEGVSRGSPCNAKREETASSARRSPIAT